MIRGLQETKAVINRADIVFWDFDGVIKDSLEAKGVAFRQLFLPYGKKLARRVWQHHLLNQGVSRFEKLPLYLKWAGESVNQEQVDTFSKRFSDLVSRAVIDSPWVPGVREYLQENSFKKYFVLLTATPQEEIDRIIKKLDINDCFREVHGSPKKKSDVIEFVLTEQHLPPSAALLIGDSKIDLEAAEVNGIPFLLRRTPFNQCIQAACKGRTFNNFEL